MQKRLIALLIIGAIGYQQTAWGEDLWQVYEQAKKNDPTFRAAEADYRAQTEASSQAWAPLLPQVNASATRSKDKLDVTKSTTIPGVGTYDTDTNTYVLSLNQAIFRYDRWVGVRQANAKVARAESGLGNAKEDLILRVAQTYFDVLSANDSLMFATGERKAIEQQLQQTQQRFRVGLSAITDVHEAQARFDQATAQEIIAQNVLAISHEALRELTGNPFNQLAILKATVPLIRPDPDNIDNWVGTALKQNLALLASEKAMDIASEEMSRARAGHYPTLDFNAQRKKVDTSGDLQLKENDTVLSLQLNIPLFSGGLIASQSREAAERAAQSKELYEQQRRVTERQARSSFLSVIAGISQVSALQQALKSTQTSLEATQTGFEVGTRTMVDVLNSQQDLFRAQRDYAKSRYDYLMETLKLKQSAGTLLDEDLKQLNQWLQ
jgi:outer membrane protein